MVLDAFNCGFVVCYEDGLVAGSKHVGREVNMSGLYYVFYVD